jgi:hypothetical protein
MINPQGVVMKHFQNFRFSLLFAASVAIAMGAGNAQTKTTEHGNASQKFPDVINVKVKASGVNKFDFDVTVSSPYDTPQRYADAFRAISVTNTDVVYGERKLLHDHADEQPFTRDLYGVNIPSAVREVTIQARDQKNGYGGKAMKIILPGR